MGRDSSEQIPGIFLSAAFKQSINHNGESNNVRSKILRISHFLVNSDDTGFAMVKSNHQNIGSEVWTYIIRA
jgi:hypothetical protein